MFWRDLCAFAIIAVKFLTLFISCLPFSVFFYEVFIVSPTGQMPIMGNFQQALDAPCAGIRPCQQSSGVCRDISVVYVVTADRQRTNVSKMFLSVSLNGSLYKSL